MLLTTSMMHLVFNMSGYFLFKFSAIPSFMLALNEMRVFEFLLFIILAFY